LEGTSTSWSGVIRVTNDVIVPFGHTLTLEAGTLVLLEGVTNGVVANDISVNGALMSLGTEDQPVTVTCAQADLRYRWGQIRHNNSQPSVYRATTITRGGRAFGEGHTGTAPVLRCLGSRVRFESCNLTDFAEAAPSSAEFGRPGKILQASFGSDVLFDNCLLARARMGPELSASALLMTNSGIMEMIGTNDSDGLFLDRQQPGQSILVTHSVLAEGGDDGIDTLNAVFTVEECIIRGWRNPFEDSKGISLEAGEARIRRSLLVDNAIGISGKGPNGATVRADIDHCTILSANYAVGVTNKSGTTPIVDFRITNSILRGVVDSVFTQYDPASIRLSFCNVGEPWPGQGNIMADPTFVNPAGHDYHLQPSSPCIDAGDPQAGIDPDGSRTDIGYDVFQAPPPELVQPGLNMDGTFRFLVKAYPNRDYAVEVCSNPPVWRILARIRPAANPVEFSDTNSVINATRLYRVRLW
jgi:hypothetical protein